MGTGARDFAGGSLGAQAPLSPGECPRRPLTPAGHLHPAISGPLPPRGWDTRGRGASNGPTWRQTRRPSVTSPPLRRGPPLRMEEQGGGPQEMAFVRAAAG